uniref:Protein phosphatase 2 regulatory subunit Bbeta n=2 Tax=Yangochiroptera TaxID=30560 RepID=A0A7J8IC00_MOLMO|nr:protein phosphatase 2 regulatory subunit Bbeta [Myotis myotis]KAF6481589.1 protein phosphatase 2 regulatory subunit Bbeta [Molossus molossus]
MKCFSRYLPYIFRPPNTILSSSCHTEGSDHGAVPLAPLPPSPVRLAAGRDHGYLSAGFWFPRK